MKMKILKPAISNPSADNITLATLVHVVATAGTDLVLSKVGGEVIGNIYISANGSIDLVKDSTDKITCPTSHCTPIAYIS